MVLACVLNYLIGGMNNEPFLKPLDVAVFVAQAILEKDPRKLRELRVIIYIFYVCLCLEIYLKQILNF